MIEIDAIVAGTGLDRQGVFVTKEAILSAAEDSIGDRVPIAGRPNHDPFCMPLGKVIKTWVETREDHHVLVARMCFDDAPIQERHQLSGTDLVRLDFPNNSKPFLRLADNGTREQTTVRVDLANFDDMQGYEEFADAVRHFDDTIMCEDTLARKGFDAEPIIVLLLSNLHAATFVTLIGSWALVRALKFVNHTIDETSKKVGDELSDVFSAKILSVFRRHSGCQSKENRPAVTQIVIPGAIEMNLLTRTEPGSESQGMDFELLGAEIERYSDLLQVADSICFGREANGDWELQYLTTKSGKVIGTAKCYEKTLRILRGIRQSQNMETEEESIADLLTGIPWSIGGRQNGQDSQEGESHGEDSNCQYP